MPVGEVGVVYTATSFAATGGKPPYVWSIGAGTLPAGINLSGSSVSGTPTASGASSFTVKVTDSAGTAATSPRTITIQPALVLSGNCASTPCSVEEGCVTICGVIGSQGGGVSPYSYAALGTLPPGMGLNGLALSGPFPLGSYKFGIKVTDALGATASIAAAYDVFAHIALANGSCTQKARSGLTCQIRMTYSAGTGKPVGVVISPKTPGPKGTTAVLQTGVVLVTVPAQALPTSGKLQIIITDSALCGPAAGQRCTATATATYSFA